MLYVFFGVMLAQSAGHAYIYPPLLVMGQEPVLTLHMYVQVKKIEALLMLLLSCIWSCAEVF
jgi:hypothetical protein